MKKKTTTASKLTATEKEMNALSHKLVSQVKDAIHSNVKNNGHAKLEIAKKPPAPVLKKGKVITILEKIKVENHDHLAVQFSRIEADEASAKYAVFYDRIMHPDLRNAIQDLDIHLALLCGYLSTKQIKSLDKYEPEQLKPFKISGISIKHEEGITITGHRINDQKKAVILNTPYTLFNEDAKTRYRWMDDLLITLAIITDEVMHYLDGSKQGVEQTKIEFPEPAAADLS